MGNSVNSFHNYHYCTITSHEYIKEAKELSLAKKKLRFQKGGNGFNQWCSTIIKKQKKGRDNKISYKTLGASGQFFDTFLRLLLPEEVKEITNDLLKAGLISDGVVNFDEAKKLLDEYREKKNKKLEIKLVVFGESCDFFKFLNFNDRIVSLTGNESNELAVIIGPIILKWGKNGLVVPRLLQPLKATCIIDLRSEIELNSFNLRKISEACCHFNKYHMNNSNTSTHDFAWYLLKETLGMKDFFPPNGAIDNYLKNVLSSVRYYNGCSFTTDDQIKNFFKTFQKKDNMSEEETDFYELMMGFKTANDYRLKIKEKNKIKKVDREDFF